MLVSSCMLLSLLSLSLCYVCGGRECVCVCVCLRVCVCEKRPQSQYKFVLGALFVSVCFGCMYCGKTGRIGMCVCVFVCVCMYIYIYLFENETGVQVSASSLIFEGLSWLRL